MKLSTSPEQVLDQGDPGDDVLRRFRYQITYASIISLYLIEDEEDFLELFCEHHEDILIKHKDHSFTGIQVKTRSVDLHPFTIEDEAMISSLEKFILLDQTFPNTFRQFSIVSNHGFDRTKPAVCLNTLLNNVKDGVDVRKPRSKSNKAIQELALRCSCTAECVLDTMKKVRLRTFCAIDDIHFKLINQLKASAALNGTTGSKIEQIADLLIMKLFKASSMFILGENYTERYILGLQNANQNTLDAVSAKCIKKDDLSTWLAYEKGQETTLLLKDRVNLSELPIGHRKMEIKMDAGGIDVDNIELLRNFKFAFEQHAIGWIYKDSSNLAQDKYNQVLAIAQNMCKEVYDELNVHLDETKGRQMLIDVRRRIHARKLQEATAFFDCSYEHVLGSLGVLTENCKVWWSPKFEIEK